MCGILGMIGNVPEKHYRLAHTLLQNIFIFSQSRGRDSSGFSAIHYKNSNRLITEKRNIDSIKFVSRSARFKALAKDMPNIFIGHTRMSTSGTANRGRNNHPFNSKKYSLVHNGGISMWPNVVSSNNIEMRTETDSEVILHLLEQKDDFHSGIQHTMNKVGLSSRVAVAVLSHSESKRLFLFRNESNQVYIMTYPKLHTIFFASQASFLENSLKSVYGNDVSQKSRDDDISVDIVPSWKSLEFNLEENCLPILCKEMPIEKPAYNKAGFYSSNSYSYHERKHSGNNTTSTLPIVLGPHGDYWTGDDCTKEVDGKKSSTATMLKEVSEETRKDAVSLARTVRESSKVLREIRSNRFMQHLEMEHFKKYMNLV